MTAKQLHDQFPHTYEMLRQASKVTGRNMLAEFEQRQASEFGQVFDEIFGDVFGGGGRVI